MDQNGWFIVENHIQIDSWFKTLGLLTVLCKSLVVSRFSADTASIFWLSKASTPVDASASMPALEETMLPGLTIGRSAGSYHTLHWGILDPCQQSSTLTLKLDFSGSTNGLANDFHWYTGS